MPGCGLNAAPLRLRLPSFLRMQHLSRHRVGSKTEALRLLSQGHAHRSNLQTAIGSSSSRVRPIPSWPLPAPISHPLWTAAWPPRPMRSALPSRAPHVACSACAGMCAAPRALAGDGAGVHRARAVVCVLAAAAGRHAAPLAHDDLRPPRPRQGVLISQPDMPRSACVARALHSTHGSSLLLASE